MATIVKVAQELDLSTKMVNDLIARGTITKKDRGQYDLVEARTEYIRHLRSVAAGRAKAGELDLGEERARLAKDRLTRKKWRTLTFVASLFTSTMWPSSLASRHRL